MKPLAADACMKPLWCVVRSLMTTSKALPPPGAGASNMWTLIVVARVHQQRLAVRRERGDGRRPAATAGPVGTPFRWMKAKLTGSTQAGLGCVVGVHSRLSMVSAAHQCVSSQLSLSTKGGVARRVELHLHERRASAGRGHAIGASQVGALRVRLRACRAPGEGIGVAQGHGEPRRRVSSNQFETSWPGSASVGAAVGSRPRFSSRSRCRRSRGCWTGSRVRLVVADVVAVVVEPAAPGALDGHRGCRCTSMAPHCLLHVLKPLQSSSPRAAGV